MRVFRASCFDLSVHGAAFGITTMAKVAEAHRPGRQNEALGRLHWIIAATRCYLVKTFDPAVVVRIAIPFLEPPVVTPFGVLVFLVSTGRFSLS